MTLTTTGPRTSAPSVACIIWTRTGVLQRPGQASSAGWAARFGLVALAIVAGDSFRDPLLPRLPPLLRAPLHPEPGRGRDPVHADVRDAGFSAPGACGGAGRGRARVRGPEGRPPDRGHDHRRRALPLLAPDLSRHGRLLHLRR